MEHKEVIKILKKELKNLKNILEYNKRILINIKSWKTSWSHKKEEIEKDIKKIEKEISDHPRVIKNIKETIKFLQYNNYK